MLPTGCMSLGVWTYRESRITPTQKLHQASEVSSFADTMHTAQRRLGRVSPKPKLPPSGRAPLSGTGQGTAASNQPRVILVGPGMFVALGFARHIVLCSRCLIRPRHNRQHSTVPRTKVHFFVPRLTAPLGPSGGGEGMNSTPPKYARAPRFVLDSLDLPTRSPRYSPDCILNSPKGQMLATWTL